MGQRLSALSVLVLCVYIAQKPCWPKEGSSPSRQIHEVILSYLEVKIRKEKPSVTLSLSEESFSEAVPVGFCADDFAEFEDLLGCSSDELAQILQASQDVNPETWQATNLRDLRPQSRLEVRVWLSPPLMVKSLPFRRFILYLADHDLGLIVVDVLPSERVVFDLPLGKVYAH